MHTIVKVLYPKKSHEVTVVDLARFCLQYITGAAATTFFVKVPKHTYAQQLIHFIKFRIS